MPEIRAFRALRYNPEMLPDLARVVAPPYDVISPGRRPELAARDPHNVVAIDLPVDAGAADPDEKYRQAARTFAGMALGRDAAQGPPAVALRLRAGVHRSRNVAPARPAGLLRAPSPGGVRARRRGAPARADAGRAQGGPLQADARDGRQLLGRDGPLRRRHRRRAPPARRGDGDGGRRRRDRRRRRPAPPLGGPRRGADRAARGRAARRGRARAGDHRRRPPPLRDGAPLPGRAPDDPLVRGGPALRLRARAVHGHVGRAAPGAADTPRGARGERRRRARRGGRRRRGSSTSDRPIARRSSRPSARRHRRPAVAGGSGSGRAPAAPC